MLTFCQVCTHNIPEPRHRKNSRTCSKECQKQYRSERLAERKLRLREAAAKLNTPKAQKQAGNSVPEAIQVTQ